MRDGVLGVAGDRALVKGDCLVEATGFEQQVSEIRERGRVAGLLGQRRFEIRLGPLAPFPADPRHPAFIEKEGAFAGRIARLLEQGGKLALRGFEVTAAQGFERASKIGSIPEHFESMFEIDVITLFPEVFAPFVGLSIVGRAVEAGLVSVRYHHLLDYLMKAERADDAPFGGGPGMVMRVEPIVRVLEAIGAPAAPDPRQLIVLTSPAGRRFDQEAAERFSRLRRLILVCGHYEGVDERLGRLYPVEEHSLGDFVLTGGEIPALAFMDATIRRLAGAIRPESLAGDSFAGGLLDYPSYTRPASFRGIDVPAVLLSGNHAEIAKWRREQSRLRTAGRRRDLLNDALQPEETP